MEYENNEIYKAGMAAGRKELMDHIICQYERGKPILINGRLFWLRDERQNLMDIMDDIETTWDEEHGK